MSTREAQRPGAPACLRCVPRRQVPTGRAHLLGVWEPSNGCACLADCGQPGCTGTPQPSTDKPTRLYTPPKREGEG